MKKVGYNKRQLKKLEAQMKSGAIAKMKNTKIRDRLLKRAKELLG